ncbi:MAG: hypothetical protein F6J93_16325 [Oscillatoria sp. SIO1A7]|nr:hypothetical protein [Oscillatoria sp. SIO1A7]
MPNAQCPMPNAQCPCQGYFRTALSFFYKRAIAVRMPRNAKAIALL